MKRTKSLDPKIQSKLAAVTRAAMDLQKISQTKGRVALRTARRSLWARIQALKEECDAQYVLPKKKSDLPPMTLKEKARRYSALAFRIALNKEITTWLSVTPWPAHLSIADCQAYVAATCDEFRVETPLVLTGIGERAETLGTDADSPDKFLVGSDWLKPIPDAYRLAEFIRAVATHARVCAPTKSMRVPSVNDALLIAWKVFKNQEWKEGQNGHAK